MHFVKIYKHAEKMVKCSNSNTESQMTQQLLALGVKTDIFNSGKRLSEHSLCCCCCVVGVLHASSLLGAVFVFLFPALVFLALLARTTSSLSFL